MKQHLILQGLFISYFVLELLSGNSFGALGGLIWSIFLAIVFSIAVKYYTRHTVVVIATAVSAVTIIFPITILLAIIGENSILAGIKKLAEELAMTPIHSAAYFVCPLAAALLTSAVMQKYVPSWNIK